MIQNPEIILLCNDRVADDLTGYLQSVNPSAVVVWANSIQALEAAYRRLDRPVRILCFLTDVIVPAHMLQQAGLTGYNIHPGTPDYPGSMPTSFAIWDEAPTYGATLHELTARVDEGAIVTTRSLRMPPTPEERALGDLAFAISVELFCIMGQHCALSLDDMPLSGEVWVGPKRTRSELKRLKASFASLDLRDRERMMRAFSDMRTLHNALGQPATATEQSRVA